MERKSFRVTFSALIGLLMLPLASFSTHAEIISSQQAMAMESGQILTRVETWLRQEAVVEELAALGVDPEVAALRVAALSPAELEQMAERIEELPAGAGVIEVLGITFLVLLILEFTGVINIFNR
ncbi:PA2779 family protein [Wenzhouxiangella sp. XN201]|uniref:PA2779 family protein n=1 Tax=Wenzhouxiangella sp. XN201 TaxID=2710755 RepID=UPI0013CD138D|nr:PA2779 family protein [Wenzhouxiangella sp. XN201]NEZ04947.1 PA2779 family protein [Wenzhouxiangella sp. XN201]